MPLHVQAKGEKEREEKLWIGIIYPGGKWKGFGQRADRDDDMELGHLQMFPLFPFFGFY
jgi:hypothetical protein